MSMGSWLKAHRKQVITHTSIIVGVALLTVFVVEPLFDRWGEVAGESELCDVTLPPVSDNIEYFFDQFQATAQVLELRGWAFIWGYDSLNTTIYIVLKSAYRTYVFTTEAEIREGVTASYKDLDLNLDYSGFSALIPTGKVASGKYTVGIYIRKGDIEALEYDGETSL